jgi:hypothetical protein
MSTKTLFGILSITMALVINGRSQIYQFSTPMSGSFTLSAQDLNGPAGSSGMCTVNFSALTETVYVDLGANTFRQVGVASCTPTNIQFQETQGGISGMVTVHLGPSGGSVLFDTGAVGMTPTEISYCCSATNEYPGYINYGLC